MDLVLDFLGFVEMGFGAGCDNVAAGDDWVMLGSMVSGPGSIGLGMW